MSGGVVKSAKVIGKALGVSERTIRRMAKAGKLAVKKGPNTSPYAIERGELERLRKARGTARA